jgi:hypothetical protein
VTVAPVTSTRIVVPPFGSIRLGWPSGNSKRTVEVASASLTASTASIRP